MLLKTCLIKIWVTLHGKYTLYSLLVVVPLEASFSSLVAAIAIRKVAVLVQVVPVLVLALAATYHVVVVQIKGLRIEKKVWLLQEEYQY